MGAEASERAVQHGQGITAAVLQMRIRRIYRPSAAFYIR